MCVSACVLGDDNAVLGIRTQQWMVDIFMGPSRVRRAHIYEAGQA